MLACYYTKLAVNIVTMAAEHEHVTIIVSERVSIVKVASDKQHADISI